MFNEKLRASSYLSGWRAGDPAEKAADLALKYVSQGFTAVKFDPVDMRTSDRLETLTYAEGVGDGCDILIGTHGQFTTEGAIRFAKRVEQYDPRWFEEPVAP